MYMVRVSYVNLYIESLIIQGGHSALPIIHYLIWYQSQNPSQIISSFSSLSLSHAVFSSSSLYSVSLLNSPYSVSQWLREQTINRLESHRSGHISQLYSICKSSTMTHGESFLKHIVSRLVQPIILTVAPPQCHQTKSNGKNEMDS